MKLMYRGVAYDYNPHQTKVVSEDIAVSVTEAAQPISQLHYRGATYSLKFGNRPIHELLCYPIRNLFYRGAAYKLNGCVPS